ncbi:MAG: DUF1924 domain-containing protein [Thiobacillaceae bacterium]
MKLLALPLALLVAPVMAMAETHEQILASYQAQAGAGFRPSANRGEKFFHAKNHLPNGEIATCMDCHTENLKATGKTKAHKDIEPMAPVINAKRITDPAKVEKWFRRNCRDVLGRVCTPEEKADFIVFLLSIR